MEKPLVLEDEDAAGLGVYVDSLLSLSVKERGRAALEFRRRIILGRVVEVEMHGVKGLEFLPRTFGIEVCAIAVSFCMISMASRDGDTY